MLDNEGFGYVLIMVCLSTHNPIFRFVEKYYSPFIVRDRIVVGVCILCVICILNAYIS